jgi:hypothetical protein
MLVIFQSKTQTQMIFHIYITAIKKSLGESKGTKVMIIDVQISSQIPYHTLQSMPFSIFAISSN